MNNIDNLQRGITGFRLPNEEEQAYVNNFIKQSDRVYLHWLFNILTILILGVTIFISVSLYKPGDIDLIIPHVVIGLLFAGAVYILGWVDADGYRLYNDIIHGKYEVTWCGVSKIDRVNKYSVGVYIVDERGNTQYHNMSKGFYNVWQSKNGYGKRKLIRVLLLKTKHDRIKLLDTHYYDLESGKMVKIEA